MSFVRSFVALSSLVAFGFLALVARADHLKNLQTKAVADGRASWGHWGLSPGKYSGWKTHSNRLIPVYAFGVTLDDYKGANSVYRDGAKLADLYGRSPFNTRNPQAEYLDQTDVYRLQRDAAAAGKKYIFLIVFDGMDWQTTRAAAIYRRQAVEYAEGRGTGLYFQDFRAPVNDFGYFVCSPHNEGTEIDVDAQIVKTPGGKIPGGYDWRQAGVAPWAAPPNPPYMLSQSTQNKQTYTDSSSAATSLCTGVKTYNDSVNVDWQGKHIETIAQQLQQKGFGIGVVTSVPISHATPACAYAQNVHRDDYQDLTRDLVGLPSVSHKSEPLAGVDVLLGGGWGDDSTKDGKANQAKEVKSQGKNFVPGNRWIVDEDLKSIDAANGGKYRVVQRTAGKSGKDILAEAARDAEEKQLRLFGMFGAKKGHLPFRTADGKYDPAPGISPAEKYTAEDLQENPTLADLTEAALTVLSRNDKGFWLMIEAGDVDWANHDNNLDNSIGAVLSGDDAFRTVVQWIQVHDAWKDSAVILTADHGHYLVLDDPAALVTPAK